MAHRLTSMQPLSCLTALADLDLTYREPLGVSSLVHLTRLRLASLSAKVDNLGFLQPLQALIDSELHWERCPADRWARLGNVMHMIA